MKRIMLFLTAACLLPSLLQAQDDPAFLGYREAASLLLSTPGSMENGLGGFINPALPAASGQPGLVLAVSSEPDDWKSLDRAGVFGALGGGSLGLLYFRDIEGQERANLRLGLAAGNGSFSVGWANEAALVPGGEGQFFHAWTAGTIVRPWPYLSLGISGTAAYSGDLWETVLDLGIRPFATPLLTLFADYALRKGEELADGSWSAGLAAEPLPGLLVAGGYSSERTFAVGAQVSLGTTSFWSRLGFDDGGAAETGAHGLRLGQPRPAVTDRGVPPAYLRLNLLGPLVYQQEFLSENHSLLEVLEMIREASADPRIAGIALNVSGLAAGRVALWELREALKAFRTGGKRVVVYLASGGGDLYTLASAADHLVMDPNGMLLLPGYRSGRFYLRGSLDKLGIGYEEWRLYTYKSAGEMFSRDSMSEADREQYQAYIDEIAAQSWQDLQEARGLSAERLNEIMTDMFVLNSEEALEAGLIDAVGRWEEMSDLVAELEGERKSFITYGRSFRRGGWTPEELLEPRSRYRAPREDSWGEPPTIAVVYALGATALDSGMNARRLSDQLGRLAADKSVKAVVLRVDSPGGSPVAADLVAEAVKKTREQKPVIVSQGSVAASGGYWVSMYADAIVASPYTLTGSIGVIGGWFYDRGFNEKLGISTDLVQRGLHADLGFGFLLPDRNLTAAERERMNVQLKAVYSRFLAGVAEGRDMSVERVGELAQGRVWSGIAAENLGLVDELGGLQQALAVAKQRAGLEEDTPVRLKEFPRSSAFVLPGLIRLAAPPPPQVRVPDALLENLKFRLSHNGRPLLLLPLDIPTEQPLGPPPAP
jgi:protease-4